MSEPIVLLLLRVPVQLITVITTVLGTLFYAPSYLMFLLIQPIIFNDNLKMSYFKYVASWPFRFIALVVSFTLFIGQFIYAITYALSHTEQTNKYVIGGSLAVSVPCIIYLMRRGYLKALMYFKVPQLKSPKEFTTELLELVGDIPGIILTVVNILLLKEALNTFKFQYKCDERTYFEHIWRLVRTAFFYDIERVFVWYLTIFPWRKNDSVDLKQQINHSANRLAILFLLTLQTSLDIPIFLLFGWLPFFSPYRSYKRYLQLFRNYKGTYRKYVFTYFCLTLFQYFGLLVNLLAICTFFQTKAAFENIKHCFRYIPSLNDLSKYDPEGRESSHQNNLLIDNYELELMTNGFYLLGVGLLEIVLLGFRALVWVSRYKEKKLAKFEKEKIKEAKLKSRQALEKSKELRLKGTNPNELPIQNNLSYECQKKVFLYALEFIVDIPFFPLSLLSALLKPWDFKYYISIINDKYDVDRLKVFENFFATILFYISLIAFMVLLPLYAHRLRWLYNYAKTLQLEDDQSHNKTLVICGTLLIQIYKDLPYLPLYYCMTISGAFLFNSSKQQSLSLDISELAVKYNDYFNEIISLYYQIRVMISPKQYSRFKLIYEKDKQNFIGDSIYNKKVFWSTATAVRRYENMSSLLRIYLVVTYLRKKSHEKIMNKLREQPIKPDNLSQITKEYIRSKKLLLGTVDICVKVTIEIVIGLVALLILLPLTSWRFPTLYFILNDQKRFTEIAGDAETKPKHVRLITVLIFVLSQQLVDLTLLPMYLSGLIFGPLRFLKYCYNNLYIYKNQNYTITFKKQLDEERQYFADVIWRQSLRNILSVAELIGVGITVVRIRWLIRLVNKANHNFKRYVKRVLALNTDPTIEEWKEELRKIKPQSEKISLRQCIHLAFVEALKDIPFVFISLFIFVFFPWRFNYLWNVLKDQHERLPTRMRNGQINVVGKRRDIILLMGNIITTDFVCLFLNIILILSIYKTKKGFELVIKNLKRNLIVGFLSYDYRRELACEIKLMYKDFVYFFKTILIVCMVTRVRPTYIKLYALYRERQQKQQIKKYTREVYAETLKSGKQEQLTNIGFYSFAKICDYLEPNDLQSLQAASKGLYIWTNEEQIWQNQWQKKYKAISQAPNLPVPYRELVGNSFKAQYRPKKIQLTYQMIIDEQLEKSIHKPILISDYVSEEKLMFRNWSPRDGFQGGNIVLDQASILIYIIFILPLEAMMNLIILFFGNNDYRIIKQGLFFCFVFTFYIGHILFVIFQFTEIFSIGKFIAFKIMLIIYVILINFFCWMRVSNLRYVEVPALKPFDFIWEACEWIKDRVVSVAGYANHYVLSPLYKIIVKGARIVGDVIGKVLEGIAAVLRAIGIAISNIFGAIKTFIVGLATGYLQILAKTMKFFLKFGRLGDLIFTPIALAYLALPLILSYIFYWKGVVIVPASVLTAVLYIRGYSVLREQSKH